MAINTILASMFNLRILSLVLPLMRKGYVVMFIGCLMLVLFAACGEKKTYLVGKYYDGLLFGKQYQIDVVGDSTNYRAAIDSIVNVFEQAFDLADPNSILSQYNAFQRTDTVFAFHDSSRIFGVAYSLLSDYNRHTYKYYDPTTNPLKRAWVSNKLLQAKEPNLDSLFNFVGFDGAKVDMNEISSNGYDYVETHLRKADPRIELDMTNFAAAMAIDHLANFLKERGVVQVRIKYGKSTVCFGQHDPSLNLVSTGLASDSGDQKIQLFNHAFTYKVAEDKAFMVDPTYGYPVENEMMYVATACPTLAQAEVFAEAFCIMGIDQASTYYQSDSNSTVQSYIFFMGDDQMLHNASTKAFDAMLVQPNVSDSEPVK
jgi:thiamine biosynthesis lipoprotein ApbE